MNKDLICKRIGCNKVHKLLTWMWIKQSQKGKFSYILTIYSFSAVFDKQTAFDANGYKRSHVISLVNICVDYRMFARFARILSPKGL